MSHCADRGNFLAMCLRTSAKGWRRVRDICDDLAIDGFATIFVAQKSITSNGNRYCYSKYTESLDFEVWKNVKDTNQTAPDQDPVWHFICIFWKSMHAIPFCSKFLLV